MMNCKNLFLVLSILLTCSSVFAQNVGIGENNPGSKLSVKGNLSVGTNYANATAPLNGIIVEGNVGIGTSVPNASALLEMNAADKGLLVPRMALSATNSAAPVSNPADALLVFNTTTAGVGTTAVSPGFYYWDGTQWIRLITSDTDAQTLFFNIQTGDLSISNGNTINIPQVTDTDDQILSLDTSTHVLSIDNGNSVDLTPYLDNTDVQTLGYNGITGVLDISGGNSVIIPVVIDTDAQTLSYDTLTGDLSIDNGNTVNLTGLNANDWHITGNTGTNSLTHFLGTSDNEPLRFRTNNMLSGEINPNGNTFLGYQAGVANTGIDNTFVGGQAGFTTLGSGNVFLGFQAGYNETGSNKLYISNNNTTTPIIYGDFVNNKLAVGGNSPAHKLHINGGPLWTSDSWAGSLELNNTAAIGWNTNGTYSYGMGSSTNGLYIWHTTSTPATTTSAATYRMILHNNGYTAIGANLGTAYVPSAPLHVDGFSNSGLGNFAYYAYSAGTATGVANGSTDVSIYATNRVRAAEFNAFSDARIKDIVSISEKEQDLATLMRLTVTNYRHKDVVSKGNDLKKGFIAQDVENIFSEAVTKSTDFIPNIYAVATNIIHKNGELVISLPNTSDLQVGEKVRLIADTYKQDVKITAIIDANTFICEDFAGSGDKIFVYGKEVSDFRAVDYDRIFTLNVSATQALAEKLAKLQQENEKLKALNESYELRFQRIEAKIGNNIR